MAISPSQSRNGLPPEVLSIIWPALQVGSMTGVSGLLFGSVAGILRSTTPTLFALASGMQWFMLGSSFWATRCVVLQASGEKYNGPRDKVSASCIAGAVGGGAGGLLRGRKNVIPGIAMFAIFGAAGQSLYNMADARHEKGAFSDVSSEGTKSTWLDSKWSPVKVLSDVEYGKILEEQLIRVEAEMALMDERITMLKRQTADSVKVKDKPDEEDK